MRKTIVFPILIIAFLFKMVGSSWDVSYHFKYFRELTQLPHLVNITGFIIILVMWIYFWRNRKKEERKSIYIMGVGLSVTFIGIPLDDMWHRTFGIDLTIWSPPHMILYVSTFIVLLGVIRLVEVSFKQKEISPVQRKIYLTVFSTVALANVWFPLLQQELGVLALYFVEIGKPIASKDLMALINSPKSQIFGGIPDWVYAVYASFAIMYAFNLAKKVRVHYFSATSTVTIYIVYRFIVDYFFIESGYQPSTLPCTLLLAGIVFDFLYFVLRDKKYAAYVGMVFAVLSFYCMIFVETIPPFHPEMSFLTLPFSFASGLVGIWLAERMYKWIMKDLM